MENLKMEQVVDKSSLESIRQLTRWVSYILHVTSYEKTSYSENFVSISVFRLIA
jgi:hypothetical protein